MCTLVSLLLRSPLTRFSGPSNFLRLANRMPRATTQKIRKAGCVYKPRAPKGSGNYPCIYVGCNKMSTRSNDVLRHFKSHFEETKLENQCPWKGCSFTTRQKSNLNSHYLTHLNVKPDTADHSETVLMPVTQAITVASLITSEEQDGLDFQEYLKERIQSVKEAADEQKQRQAKALTAKTQRVAPYSAHAYNHRNPPAQSTSYSSHRPVITTGVNTTTFLDSPPQGLLPQRRLGPLAPVQLEVQHSPPPYNPIATPYSTPSPHISAYTASQATMSGPHLQAKFPTAILVAPTPRYGVNTHFAYITPPDSPQPPSGYQVPQSMNPAYSTQVTHDAWVPYHNFQSTPVSCPSAYGSCSSSQYNYQYS
ncbi:hypothetical protein BJ912DRAFT_496045 [Pholiota molesta]|nr:hypothetical protein BJ912DRAFT_496045 [Pholiota molesta]